MSVDRISKSITTWVDGQATSTKLSLTESVSNTTSLVIGGTIDLASELPALNGQVDEVGIYPGLLSDTDVQSRIIQAQSEPDEPGEGGLVRDVNNTVTNVPTGCSKVVDVNFLVYTYLGTPSGIACWGYWRIYQNSTVFMICKSDHTFPHEDLTRQDQRQVFDDTNPTKDYSNEPGSLSERDLISECAWEHGRRTGILYGAYMANRSAGWCLTNSNIDGCWRRPKGLTSSPVDIKRRFAELYTDDSVSGSACSTSGTLCYAWKKSFQTRPYVIGPATSYAAMNIQPDVRTYCSNRKTCNGSSSPLHDHIRNVCNLVTGGNYLTLYSQQIIWSDGSTGVPDAALAVIVKAMNDCTKA
jgi:hypothetical protein